MKPMHRVDMGDIRVEAPTMREAKATLANLVKAAVTGSYNPWMFTDKGKTLLVWREPDTGWTYRIVEHVTDNGQRGQFVHPNSYYGPGVTFMDVRQIGVYHFAQTCYGIYETFDAIPSLLLWEMGNEKSSELKSWWQWQDRYKAAKAAGHNADECRRIADQR